MWVLYQITTNYEAQEEKVSLSSAQKENIFSM